MQRLVFSLTVLRIILAPIIFICAVYLEDYWLAFWLFNVAALTDYFDGKLARKYHVESMLGAILDPIGDKLLLLFVLIAVIVLSHNNFISLIAALILAREFWVSALREYSISTNNRKATSVTLIAKIKTTMQFVALGLFFLGLASDLALLTFLSYFFLLISLLLAFKSSIDYTKNTFNS